MFLLTICVSYHINTSTNWFSFENPYWTLYKSFLLLAHLKKIGNDVNVFKSRFPAASTKTHKIAVGFKSTLLKVSVLILSIVVRLSADCSS